MHVEQEKIFGFKSTDANRTIQISNGIFRLSTWSRWHINTLCLRCVSNCEWTRFTFDDYVNEMLMETITSLYFYGTKVVRSSFARTQTDRLGSNANRNWCSSSRNAHCGRSLMQSNYFASFFCTFVAHRRTTSTASHECIRLMVH